MSKHNPYPREALKSLSPAAAQAAISPLDFGLIQQRIEHLDYVAIGGVSADATLIASLTALAVENAYRGKAFRCSGCGSTTDDPDADLAEIRDKGGLACCPERKMLHKNREW